MLARCTVMGLLACLLAPSQGHAQGQLPIARSTRGAVVFECPLLSLDHESEWQLGLWADGANRLHGTYDVPYFCSDDDDYDDQYDRRWARVDVMFSSMQYDAAREVWSEQGYEFATRGALGTVVLGEYVGRFWTVGPMAIDATSANLVAELWGWDAPSP